MVFNEACRYHLDNIVESYQEVVEKNLYEFFANGFFAKLMDIDYHLAKKLAPKASLVQPGK